MVSQRTAVQGGKALEMKMQDTLDGLEELSTMAGFSFGPGVVEILSIERHDAPPPPPPRSNVVTLPTRDRCDPPLRLAAAS